MAYVLKKAPKRIICIVGPTASGKSGYALKVAHEMGGEIINADSMQVYKYMNIGSAKINAHIILHKKTPFYLI